MDEYIKKEKIIKEISSLPRVYVDHVDPDDVISAIRKIKGENVAPIIIGKWIEDGDNQPISCDKIYCCSNCKKNRKLESQFTQYCSNCGAKMNGGTDYKTEDFY